MTQLKSLEDLVVPGQKPELSESKKRKQVRRVNVADILTEKGVRFENKGAKLMIQQDEGPEIEFWHGAGRWQELKVKGKVGYGLGTLLEYLGLA